MGVDAEQGTSSGRVSNATDHSDEFVSIEKELKELRSKSGTPNTDYHLAVGDVAWAKYGRWPQWPVLVRLFIFVSSFFDFLRNLRYCKGRNIGWYLTWVTGPVGPIL